MSDDSSLADEFGPCGSVSHHQQAQQTLLTSHIRLGFANFPGAATQSCYPSKRAMVREILHTTRQFGVIGLAILDPASVVYKTLPSGLCLRYRQSMPHPHWILCLVIFSSATCCVT